MLSHWKIIHFFNINKSEMTITYKYTNSTIIFLGVDDVEKLKSIAGVTSVFVEEATELTADEFTQIDLRLRGETQYYKQIMLAFNPISTSNWVKKHWFDEIKEDSLVVKTTYLDNNYIDEQYKSVLDGLKATNYDLYKVYALGEFGVLKGVIYPKYTEINRMPDDLDVHGVGIDFGYTDPMAVVECGIKGNNLYLNELVYESGLITRDIIPKLPKDVHLYCDAAEPDRIQEMRRAGLWASPGIKDVMAGINRVKSYNIFVTSSSVNVIRDLQTYSWKEDREGNQLDIPNHMNSHSPDAIRYFVHTATQGKVETHTFNLPGL